MDIILSGEQEVALSKIRAGKNVLLTAEAGCGKSVVIDHILDQNTVLCAPTGIAALNIGGATCHRTFGLPLGVPTAKDFMSVSRKVKELFNIYSPVKRIVIDEISCLNMALLELINAKLQLVRGNKKPWGGLQVVVVGDYFQLDPVITSRDETAYFSEYPSQFNFKSGIFDFELVELTKVFRQQDKRQAKMLGSIRQKDKYYKLALDTIVKEAKPYEPNEKVTVLCCYKNDVRRYNRKYFKRLTTPIYNFKAKIEDVKVEDEWRDSTVSHSLDLREGCRVMFKANEEEGLYVNGEKGVVTYVDNVIVRVKKENGDEVTVLPNTWEKIQYKNKGGALEKDVVSKFTQIPLELAYAQSIHVSQGQTLEDVAIDVGKGCFSHGQFYVALSRCKDLKRISFVKTPSYEDVIVHKEVKQFYRSLRDGK